MRLLSSLWMASHIRDSSPLPSDPSMFITRAFSSTPTLSARVVDHCMGWDEIVTHLKRENYAAFGRLEKDADFYDESNARMKEEWDTVADYILHREFRLPVYIHPVSQKKHCNRDRDVERCSPQRNLSRYGGFL